MKKNSNRSHHQNRYQFATFARMTDRNAQIKHQSKLSRLLQKVSMNEHNDEITEEVIDGQTEGE